MDIVTIVTEFVVLHPYLSIGIGFAVTFLLSGLLTASHGIPD